MAGVHRRFRTPGLRADGYWAGLADWHVPAGERIARDRVGLAQAAP
jgi:peptide/nickel transport system substrate-binding protein